MPPGYPVPIQGCWKDKSQNGASWGLWLNFGLGVTALTVFGLRYYFHKPTIPDDSTLNTYNIPEDELKEIIIAMNPGNHTNISNNPINATTTAKVAFEQANHTIDRMKITLKDRPSALTFFMRSHQIKKGTVFGSGINKKIAEFLGCPDLPEIAQSKLKKRN